MRHGVVFDIDDTLYLERDYVRSGFEAVGAHVEATLELPGFAAAAWRLFEDGVRGQTFDRALSALGADARSSNISELVALYRSHVPRISLLADAQEAIDYLSAEGVPMGVITDGPEASQRAKASALGLHDSMQHVIFTDELGQGYGKPDHRSFEMIAAALGEPERLVYIADNPGKDFSAPHRSGWTTWRIRRPDGLHVSTESGPDVRFETETIMTPVLHEFLQF